MTSNAKGSRAMDWILFLISAIAFFVMLMYWSEWFWVTLPFMLTFLVKAMNRM